MNEARVEVLPLSFMQDSKLLAKVLDKLSKDLQDHDRADEFTKKSVSMVLIFLTKYLNTFTF
jgi:hypothetical protein